MTDLFDTAFCSVCGEQTLHFRLGQRRLECSDCHETREAGPNQLWDEKAPAPICPHCGGSGFVRIDDIKEDTA